MKRRQEALNDRYGIELESPSKRLAQSSSPVTPSSLDNLAWPEVFASILRVDGVFASDDDEVILDRSFGENSVLYTDETDPQTSNGLAVLADVGQRIESWTDATMNQRHTPHIQAVDLSYSELDEAEISNPDRQQCFGMIHECRVRLIYDMPVLLAKLSKLSSRSPWVRLEVSFATNLGFLAFDDGSPCAQLEDRLHDPLRRICDICFAWLIAYVSIKDWMTTISRARSQKQTETIVDINVYGFSTVRSEVGRCLSNDSLYLQHVKHCEEELEYENPHMLSHTDIELHPDAMDIDHVPSKASSQDEVQQAILDICMSETKDRAYENVAGTALVTQKLLPYQPQAISFMVERETGLASKNSELWKYIVDETQSCYRHLITGLQAAEAPVEVAGGILADDPGMGKTLTTLNVIALRLADGSKWSQSRNEDYQEDQKRHIRSRATLIVVPNLSIIDQWHEEIQKHMASGLKILKYHGKGRGQQMDSIADSDMVFTTYHTLAKESAKSPLRSIHWFRLVLDEAHFIRRQATTFFAAAAQLEAHHRWCLTGTPIQNKLDDLGSLLAFIRASPFDKSSLFRKYIIAPFLEHENLNRAKDNLSLLLNSVCIRRCSDRLGLPPMQELPRKVEFSGQEQVLYDETLEAMLWAFSHGSQERDTRQSNTPFGKFQIQLQLRRLCNHGTFQRPWEREQYDLQAQKEDAVTSIGMDVELRCSSCHEKTPILNTNCVSVQKLPSCRHVVCHNCIGQLAEDAATSPTESTCPLCASGNHLHHARLGSKVKTPSRLPEFVPKGFSSKMERLMQDVETGLESRRSIIFSSWTTSLDLVQMHLQRRGLSFMRVDGDTDLTKRQPILKAFAVDPDIRILLMTYGTGAYGLNLTAVNRIFLLEPQWNPSIEIQAIARAQRYLQKQTVTVFRYVVLGSVEEDIQKQQGKKLGLAGVGFSR